MGLCGTTERQCSYPYLVPWGARHRVSAEPLQQEARFRWRPGGCPVGYYGTTTDPDASHLVVWSLLVESGRRPAAASRHCEMRVSRVQTRER
jgi:hypothetical protein